MPASLVAKEIGTGVFETNKSFDKINRAATTTKALRDDGLKRFRSERYCAVARAKSM
jgi:hypothetical protein